MRIFLVGVSCVGKTTIGEQLASLLGLQFFDLDHEIERFFGTSIERLQSRFLTMHSYRKEASKALIDLLSRSDTRDCVIALPPSGLMGGYLQAVKKTDGITVVLIDKAENILARIIFYDNNSRPLERKLMPKEKRHYLREIKKDITYFRPGYERADLQVDISGLDARAAAKKIKDAVGRLQKQTAGYSKSNQPGEPDR